MALFEEVLSEIKPKPRRGIGISPVPGLEQLDTAFRKAMPRAFGLFSKHALHLTGFCLASA
jgi:hypothetical protein